MNEDSRVGKRKGGKDGLVVKIIFGHLLPEIFQPGTGVDLFPYRLDVIDLAVEGRADECGRRVVSMDGRSGRKPGSVGPGGRLTGNVWAIGGSGGRGLSGKRLCGGCRASRVLPGHGRSGVFVDIFISTCAPAVAPFL